MRVGVLADIHADFDALERALEFFQSRGVDEIICAGDLVDKGFDGDDVVALIQERGIPTVQGNHDHTPSSSRSLSDDTREFISTLPDELRFRRDNRQVYMTHATPWSQWQYLLPQSTPTVFRHVAKAARADVVVVGHTHIPMLAVVGSHTLIVNPGSASADCSYGDDGATCGILTLDGRIQFDVYALDIWQPVQPEKVVVS
ncbi:MAG: metallophosphoesterase family protein [Chloroflexota bacterium]